MFQPHIPNAQLFLVISGYRTESSCEPVKLAIHSYIIPVYLQVYNYTRHSLFLYTECYSVTNEHAV